MKLKKSPEPANIIWDNVRTDDCRFFCKVIFYFILIGTMLFGAFIAVVHLQKYSIELKNAYPEFNCQTLFKHTPDKDLREIVGATYMKLAGDENIDYLSNDNIKINQTN